MSENKPDDLDSLATRIEQAKTDERPHDPNGISTSQMSMAWRISIELVAGVAVGGVIGYFADKWSGLSPLFLLLGISLGAIAGFRNMWRSLKNSDQE